MNEEISQEEITQKIANLPSDEREFIQEQLEHFFPIWIGEKQKESFAKNLVKKDIDFILGVIQISSISQDDIDKVKEDTIYCEALTIVYAITRKETESVDNAICFYSENLSKTVAHYESKIEEYKISKLPKKKVEQITNLIAKGDDNAAQKIIADGINSNNFKWSKQLKEIKKCMDILKSELNFDIRLFSAEAISVNPSIVSKIAYALSFPDFQLRFVIRQILENISPIPYDWYLRRNLSINEYKQVVTEMAENFTSAANTQYNIACSRIMKNASVPVLGIRRRKSLIMEIISLLSGGYVESARIVSFVLIEGLLWQIINEVNKKENFIQSNSNEFANLHGTTFQSTRIRDIIKQTVVSKYVDSDFIEHFCDELYDERNPVLHGSDQCYSCPNAGICLFGKILVLDYVIEKLIELQKNNLFSTWDKMPDDVKTRIMSVFLKTETQM